MKHVIVTGGSRGIGLGIVARLLDEGYCVTAGSRSRGDRLDELAARHPGRLNWECLTLGQDDADEFVARAVRWAGEHGLYGLINNAGLAAEGLLATFPKGEISRLLQVNLFGALEMARAVLRVLLTSGTAGRIVNISSIIGLRGYSGLAAYSATKAGLDGVTRALAREVGSRGITVNSVAPGYVATEMSSTLDEKQIKQIVRRTPLGRLATTADVAAAVSFLLSGDASFISGQTLVVDGALTC